MRCIFVRSGQKLNGRVSLIARSRSASAVTIIAFLPPVSAERSTPGLSFMKSLAVDVAPVKMMQLTRGSAMSLAADRFIGAIDELQHLFGNARFPERIDKLPAAKTASGAGLKSTQLPAAEQPKFLLRESRSGKFQGGVTSRFLWVSTQYPCRLHLLQAAQVIFGKIDRLRDFWIPLENRFSSVGHHHADQIARAFRAFFAAALTEDARVLRQLVLPIFLVLFRAAISASSIWSQSAMA